MWFVNNSYLGLIRQAQRNFDMNYCVSLGFDNINTQETDDGDVPKGYGVDHLRVVEGLRLQGNSGGGAAVTSGPR